MSIRESAWAPLSTPIFRMFWIASIVSNMGTWIHEVGAGWLMTSLDPSPEMVSAVRVAMTVPMMLMAIPAGVIADRLDRRTLLILVQWFLFASASTMTILTYTGKITSWSLLALTFLTGIGMTMHVLTWQSTIPELIPRIQLSRAIALGSISFNLARSIGPAVGGFLIALAGTWIAFAVNACSFAGVLIVLWFWKRESVIVPDRLSIATSLRQGFGFVGSSITMRHTLIRLSLFLIPAASLWSLLPLIARQQMNWDERGFGFLVTVIGFGAVAAAWILHRLHRRFGMSRTMTVSCAAFACSLAGAGLTENGAVMSVMAVFLGGSWMMALTTLNSEAQMSLPNHLRARGMSFYYAVMSMSMSVGSLIWGQVAGIVGIGPAVFIASITLVATSLLAVRYPLEEKKIDSAEF